MRPKGQSGLDAVAAMVVALLVLTAFGPVSNAFQASQKEISLRQQLRQTGELASTALTYAHWYRSLDPILSNGAFSTGKVSLHSIRAVAHAQGFECHPVKTTSVLQLTLLKEDTGLSRDIVEMHPVMLPTGMSWDPSKVVFSSCEEFVEWLP